MSNREPESRADLLQGTLDLLVLKALAAQPLHGLGVSTRINQITKGTFDVKPGSLFPALHRLEEAGWLKASIRLRRSPGCSERGPVRKRPTSGVARSGTRKQRTVMKRTRDRLGDADVDLVRWGTLPEGTTLEVGGQAVPVGDLVGMVLEPAE